MTCCVCKAENARLHAIVVAGEQLRMSPWLCDEHGAAFLFRIGHALGEVMRQHEEYDD